MKTVDNPVPVRPVSDFDDFINDEQYQSDRKSFPYLQLLQKDEIDLSGFFLSKQNAEKANFTPDDTWVAAKFRPKSGGDAIEGYRCVTPKFCVIAETPLLMYPKNREDKQKGVVFNRDTYNKSAHILKRRFLLFLLDANNQLLSFSPILFTAKGAFSAEFSEALKQYRKSIDDAANRPMGPKFHALFKLQLTLGVDVKGTPPDTNWCLTIDSQELYSKEKSKEQFLGKTDLRELIEIAFEENRDFGKRREEVSEESEPDLPEVEPTQSHQENFDDYQAVPQKTIQKDPSYNDIPF